MSKVVLCRSLTLHLYWNKNVDIEINYFMSLSFLAKAFKDPLSLNTGWDNPGELGNQVPRKS